MASNLGHFFSGISGISEQVARCLANVFTQWLPSAVMTFTNKTLTSPVISSPHITQATFGGVNLFAGETNLGVLSFSAAAYSGDGVLDLEHFSRIILDGTDVTCNMTISAIFGERLLLISCADATNAVTVTLPAGATFDGTNDIATFTVAEQALLLYGLSATRYLILANVGTVTFSSTAG